MESNQGVIKPPITEEFIYKEEFQLVPRDVVHVVVRSCLNKIIGGAFNNCRNLTSICLPDNITEISSYAFRNCSSLVSIELPESVNYIGDSAFGNCSDLTSINLPSSLTTIWDSAFSGCSKLRSIKIHLSLSSLAVLRFASPRTILINNNIGKLTDFVENMGFCPSPICFLEYQNSSSKACQNYNPFDKAVTTYIRLRDDRGRWLLCTAAEKGMKWEDGLREILDAGMPAVEETDIITSLEPFMLAAAGPNNCNLEGIFRLLQEHPAAIIPYV